MKSRQINWRESRSRETGVGEKIAVTSTYSQKLGEDFANFCGLLRIYEQGKTYSKIWAKSLQISIQESGFLIVPSLIPHSALTTNL